MASPSQASLLLQKQLKDLCKNPVDGFSAGLVDENNLFEWSVTVIGPPDTLYEGGFFNAIMSFPPNYPNSPPQVRFTSEIWHPNVYADGRVCISILHPPGDDPNGYELASEAMESSSYVLNEKLENIYELFVTDVESIVLSIISMLSSPNDESPANVEAAVICNFAEGMEGRQRRFQEEGQPMCKEIARNAMNSPQVLEALSPASLAFFRSAALNEKLLEAQSVV
ncbi:Ubiquitin-conjugating enzyme E2 7 [Bienertia sinuspersici]